MAASEYFVDPSLNSNSGTGTDIDPYGDLQHCLNTITKDPTDGDIIHVKKGTAEILAASLTLATYGTPVIGAPLTIRGYQAVANDGGIAEIDCNSVALFGSTYNAVRLQDLKIHNSGSAVIWTAGTQCGAARCEFANSTGNAIAPGASFRIVGCFIHDIGGYGITDASVNQFIVGNYFKQGAAKTMTAAILFGGSSMVSRNFIEIDSTSIGITTNDDEASMISNSVLHTGGDGINTGIEISAGTKNAHVLISNLIDGFNGSGGIGIDYGAGNEPPTIIGANAVANCETPYTTAIYSANFFDDENLGTTSPFAKTGSITESKFVSDNSGFWDEVHAYFAPVDTGNVRTGGWPYGTKGAGPIPPGGGGTTTIIIEDGIRY